MISKIIISKAIGSEENGYLNFFESQKDIPFDIKRIYYIYETPLNSKRGMHAHKNLNQVLWCPYGIIEIFLDDGIDKKTYILDAPNKLLLVGSGIWRNMYWRKERSVLCVAASGYYDEEDYIRDYDEFRKYIKEGYWNDGNKL